MVPTKAVFLELVNLNSLLRVVKFCGTISLVPEEYALLYDWDESVCLETIRVERKLFPDA